MNRVSSEEVVAALSQPATYGGEVGSVVLRETHISWVFLVGDRAYKLKKPVVLPFLDYGTAERRLEMCREEVRLNRRLAPDLYLGVRSVIAEEEGIRLGSEGDPRAIDHVVELRRYDEDATLAARLERGELRTRELARLGRRLASFHAQAAPAQPPSPPRTLERRVSADLQELLGLVGQRGEIDRLLALERLSHAFLAAHERRLDDRRRAGMVREGHGDLRADHVLVDDQVQVVDCIEFNRGLRELDVADDLSFLVMDLEARGARRLAGALLDGYRRAGGDPGPPALLAFFACRHALIRAKVALLRARQLGPGSHEHGHQSALARDLLAVAERFAWRARTPLVIAVCGLPATGKSRLSRALSRSSGLPHLNSDVTRKRLAGLTARERAPAEVYSSAFTGETYAELARHAAASVAGRGGAVVDATFRHRADRDAFREAFEAAAPVMFVECVAPLAELGRRAARRDRRRRTVSDATLEVVMRESATWEALDEVEPERHVIMRSDRPVERQLAELATMIDARLDQLAGASRGWVSFEPSR